MQALITILPSKITDQIKFYFKENVKYSGKSCQIWDPLHAQLQSCFFRYISALPAGIAIVSFVLHLLHFFKGTFYLKLTKNFIEEHAEESRMESRLNSSRQVKFLLALSIMGFSAQIMSVFYPSFYLRMIYSTFAWATTTLIIVSRRSNAASLDLIMVFTSIFVTQVIVINDKYLYRGDLSTLFSAVLSLLAVLTILNMPIRDPGLSNHEISIAFTTPSANYRSPEDNITVWQFMSVSWMEPLISLGKKRQINDEDVWSLGYEFNHRLLYEKFRELEGSVLIKLLIANRLDLYITSVLGIIELFANLISPVLLQKILQSIEEPLASQRATVIYALFALIVQLVATQSSVLNLWYSRRMYERSRGELITILYAKMLSRKVGANSSTIDAKENLEPTIINSGTRKNSKISLSHILHLYRLKLSRRRHRSRENLQQLEPSNSPASTGKLINLMRFDAYEVAQRFWDFSMIVTQPFSLVFSVILIWHLLGWPCLLGIMMVILSQILNMMLARLLAKWEGQRKTATDVKLQRISQFVEAIRHLRYYAWQDVWLSKIMEARQHELSLRIITSLWGVIISFLTILATGLFPVLVFGAFTIFSGKPLRVDIAFPALQIFSIIDRNLREFPKLITALFNARVSLARLNAFMKEPDIQDFNCYLGCAEIKLKNAFFAWPGKKNPVLYDLNLSFEPGLTIICGQVGAGKSALLLALLGELDQLDGEYVRQIKMVGYCSQTPWLQSMSIRDNILFFAPYNETRYKEVLQACALIPDLANFQHGDQYMLGENGVGLSGGQKARVSLARAVYSEANPLFLDDPLASLDHDAAEWIVQKCLTGHLLRGKTVVLVTHRLELCIKIAKQVILMSNGRASILDNHPTSVDEQHINKYVSSKNQTQGENLNSTAASTQPSFMEDENRSHGGVRAKVYWEYIKAGKLRFWCILVVVLASYRLIEMGRTWFLQQWGEAYGNPRNQRPFGRLFRDLPSPDSSIGPWLTGFFILAITKALFFLISQGVMIQIIYKAGKNLFENVMEKVSYATFRVYDITPVGRLMNRLISDINTVDGNISNKFHDVAFLSITWLFSLVAIGSIAPLFLLFSMGLSVGFIIIFLYFLPASQSLRRLEMVSLTPLISNFGAVTDGLTTIRAYCASSRFKNQVISVTDNFQKMDHFYWSLQAWLMYRLDILSGLSTFILTILALHANISAGLVAFVLSSSSRFVVATHSLCRKYGELQMDFVSVERVVELLQIPQEQRGKITPPASWPRYGSDIIFEDVSIQYAPNLQMALSNVSITIRGGSTTAVTGRSGSGKSTIALALLAVLQPMSGRIIIDGLDLAAVDPQCLRSRVSFLSQDPVLFPGNLHQNLDPLEQYSVTECEAVIAAISSNNYDWSLETYIDTGGRNLSQGQRQLIGLARVLLRRSSIVILDEVTASIDIDTSERLQTLIRHWMHESTIITIAHRPEAVCDADTIVIMNSGKIAQLKFPGTSTSSQ